MALIGKKQQEDRFHPNHINNNTKGKYSEKRQGQSDWVKKQTILHPASKNIHFKHSDTNSLIVKNQTQIRHVNTNQSMLG